MTYNDEQTQRLRALINDSPITRNIVEDTQCIYFDTDDIMPIMLLGQEEFEVWYQETKDGYHVRVLKPNWFSKGL